MQQCSEEEEEEDEPTQVSQVEEKNEILASFLEEVIVIVMYVYQCIYHTTIR